MTERVLLVAGFEALTLFTLLLPRLHRDKLMTEVMSGADGDRALRIFKAPSRRPQCSEAWPLRSPRTISCTPGCC